MKVETIRGAIDTRELGTTLMHEHVFVLTPDMLQNYPEGWDEEERVEDAIIQLRGLSELGVASIVDPTVVGLGRYIPRLQRIAAQTQINIVVATGLYTYNDIPFRFHYTTPDPTTGHDRLTDLFVSDIRDGIAGTGVRAAFLKCAIDQPGLTPGVERVMRAVARAHRETGAPITVHTSVHNEGGLIAQSVLREEGVDLARVVIGHSGDTSDLDYLRRIADEGSILGMDRFGLNNLLSFEQRIETVVRLCELGYTDRLVLSHDASCYIDWFPHAALRRSLPQWHYRHISEDVLPALRNRGVSDDQLTQMLVGNPRRYFENTLAY
ncbi:MAG TPA: phosphotriesterase-related protein [Candidatus Dormibacteraeota bacterium]